MRVCKSMIKIKLANLIKIRVKIWKLYNYPHLFCLIFGSARKPNQICGFFWIFFWNNRIPKWYQNTHAISIVHSQVTDPYLYISQLKIKNVFFSDNVYVNFPNTPILRGKKKLKFIMIEKQEVGIWEYRKEVGNENKHFYDKKKS